MLEVEKEEGKWNIWSWRC